MTGTGGERQLTDKQVMKAFKTYKSKKNKKNTEKNTKQQYT
jgi:hypothetical protein